MTRLLSTTAAIAFCLIAHANVTSAQQGISAAGAPTAATTPACKPAPPPPPGPRRPVPRPVDPGPRIDMHCAPVVNLQLTPGSALVDCDRHTSPCRGGPGTAPTSGGPVPVGEGAKPTVKQIEDAAARDTEGRIKLGNLLEASFRSKDRAFIYASLGIATVFLAVYFGAMYYRQKSAPRGQKPEASTGPALIALVIAFGAGLLIWYLWPGAPTAEATRVRVEEITTRRPPDIMVVTAAPPPAVMQAPPETAAQQTSFVVLAALLGLVAGLALMSVAATGLVAFRVWSPRHGGLPMAQAAADPPPAAGSSVAVVSAAYEVEDALQALQGTIAGGLSGELALSLGPLVRAMDVLSWELDTGGGHTMPGARKELRPLPISVSQGSQRLYELLDVVREVRALLESRYTTYPSTWRVRAIQQIWQQRQRLIALASALN